MKRALDLLTGIAELQRGASKVNRALGRNRELSKAPDVQVTGEAQSGGMTVKTHTVRNINERVGFIVHMIQKGRDDPEVRRFTTEAITKKCGKRWCIDEGEYEAEVKAVFDHIREHVRYVRDTHGKDLFQHPRRTLEFKSGDCDDYTSLVAACLQSIGYPMRVRVIRTTKDRTWSHIYALVGLPPRGPTKWVPLDASIAKPAGWEAPASMIADRKDFKVP